MRVIVTGATGLVGRALSLRLRRDGHLVQALVRSPERARSLLGAEVELLPATDTQALDRAVAGCDAVCNLAGESILGGRWTARRREALTASRVGVTERLVRAMAQGPLRPRVLVSASAVGFYGSRGEELLTEASSAGDDFLARLCVRWESAAAAARAYAARVVTLRLGVVLGRDGGMLRALLPLFRLGLGATLGSGQQLVSWIHLNDAVEVMARALTDTRYDGALNLTSPRAVRQRELTRALAGALGRPAPWRVPESLLRLALGEASTALLASQRVAPARLKELGFAHAQPTLEGALADLAQAPTVSIARWQGSPSPSVPAAPYLSRRRPAHLLLSRVRLPASPEELFAFFARPENLGAMTPARMAFRIERSEPAAAGGDGAVSLGTVIVLRLKVGPFPVRWRTVIRTWQPPRLFVDSQERGPYRCWWHEHHFTSEARGEVTMEDRVFYAVPLGVLGRAINRFFVAAALREIFGYRGDAVRLRFGSVTTPRR